jgi:hypothetical protein
MNKFQYIVKFPTNQPGDFVTVDGEKKKVNPGMVLTLTDFREVDAIQKKCPNVRVVKIPIVERQLRPSTKEEKPVLEFTKRPAIKSSKGKKGKKKKDARNKLQTDKI